MEIKDSDGYKEFKEAFVKLKMGFVGMYSESENRQIKYQLSNIESEMRTFAEIDVSILIEEDE